MVVWEGDPRVSFEQVASLEAGDLANITALELGAHTGTHVDAPLHFLPDGAGAEQLPLEVLIGPAVVLDLRRVEGDVRAADLDFPDGVERLLLKTPNSRLWDRDEFVADHVTIAPDAARLLVERGVKLVGIDYLSVGSPETHRILDRKSTRLNSSHSQISYAVFCYPHHRDLHSFPTRRSSDLDFPDGVERLLLKTPNSRLWDRDEFVADHVTIAPDAARLLVERGVKLVGIDYLSVGSPETHRI